MRRMFDDKVLDFKGAKITLVPCSPSFSTITGVSSRKRKRWLDVVNKPLHFWSMQNIKALIAPFSEFVEVDLIRWKILRF